VRPASVSTVTKSQLRVPLVIEFLTSAAQPETPSGPPA
jgi:hypothetical protein